MSVEKSVPFDITLIQFLLSMYLKEKEKDLGLKRKIRRIDSLFHSTYIRALHFMYVHICVRCSWRFVLERCECTYVCMQTFFSILCISIHHLARQANHPPTFYFHPYSFLREPQDFCKHPPVLPLYVCVCVCVCVLGSAPPGHPHLYMLMKVNTYKRKPNTGHALALSHVCMHAFLPAYLPLLALLAGVLQ
jgi:hypothetical protein